MNLKEILGDSYKEGMTFEEVSNFFDGKKFADLSTGNYVDKNKYENEVNDLKTKLEAKTTELKNKLNDDEKLALSQQEKDAEIEKLKNMLKDNKISGNKNTVNGIMLSAREVLGLDMNDRDFSTFVDNITTEDSDKSSKIANYVSKLVKDAYEKGKKDSTKNNMGQFGYGKGSDGEEHDDKNALGEFGKTLASLSGSKKQDYNYFKKQ